MSKITSVEPQIKNPKRFNLFLDGVFAFGADEDLVVNRRLVVGKELSSPDMEQLVKETEVGKLMERMYRLFNIRSRSEKEVRDYLKNLSFKRKVKGQEEISDFISSAVVERLKQLRLINDLQFAREWIEARKKKKGIRVIIQELYKKGIDKETIKEVISNQSPDTTEEQTAKKLLEKKMKSWNKLPIQ